MDMQAVVLDLYESSLPVLVAGVGWLVVRLGRKLDRVFKLPADLDELTAEFHIVRDDHESRITRIETHLNGATP